MLRVGRLQLYRHLAPCKVCALVETPERTAPDLPAEAIGVVHDGGRSQGGLRWWRSSAFGRRPRIRRASAPCARRRFGKSHFRRATDERGTRRSGGSQRGRPSSTPQRLRAPPSPGSLAAESEKNTSLFTRPEFDPQLPPSRAHSRRGEESPSAGFNSKPCERQTRQSALEKHKPAPERPSKQPPSDGTEAPSRLLRCSDAPFPARRGARSLRTPCSRRGPHSLPRSNGKNAGPDARGRATPCRQKRLKWMIGQVLKLGAAMWHTRC